MELLLKIIERLFRKYKLKYSCINFVTIPYLSLQIVIIYRLIYIFFVHDICSLSFPYPIHIV